MKQYVITYYGNDSRGWGLNTSNLKELCDIKFDLILARKDSLAEYEYNEKKMTLYSYIDGTRYIFGGDRSFYCFTWADREQPPYSWYRAFDDFLNYIGCSPEDFKMVWKREGVPEVKL